MADLTQGNKGGETCFIEVGSLPADNQTMADCVAEAVAMISVWETYAQVIVCEVTLLNCRSGYMGMSFRTQPANACTEKL